MKQNWTKRPDIHVLIAETACCGFWSHDKDALTRPCHWDKKSEKWVRCRVKAYWKLTPTAKVDSKGRS